jgi:hypothetical protein
LSDSGGSGIGQSVDQRSGGARYEDTALRCSEPGSRDSLDLGQRAAERLEIALDQTWKQPHQDEVSDPLNVGH